MPWLSQEEMLDIFSQTKTIAVVGASGQEWKDAHRIPRYLQGAGYRIVPVNPNQGRILGETSYASLNEVPVRIDLVLVFRPRDEAGAVARAAVDVGAKVLWFQPGTGTEPAACMAEDAGLKVVVGRCIEITGRGLLDRLQDDPRPSASSRHP